MATAYRQFMADKEHYVPINGRCKTFPISKLRDSDTWIIDKWWTDDEKVKLGIHEGNKLRTIDELVKAIKHLQIKLEEVQKELEQFPFKVHSGTVINL